MFDKSAAYYDLIYEHKDSAGEAAKVLSLLPGSTSSLLDVGCGTGRHHRFMQSQITIHGVDINDDLLTVARQKNPSVSYSRADMRDFSLGRAFDAVVCLFSAIGYCRSIEELTGALRCMASHLAPGGTLLVEPWLLPEVWQPGRVLSQLCHNEHLQVCRMSHSRREGHLSIMDFHYLVGETDCGVHAFQEQHVMGLYSREEMMGAFRGADLIADYDEDGLSGRGIYIAHSL